MRSFRQRFLRVIDTLGGDSFVFGYISVLFAGMIARVIGRGLGSDHLKLFGWILMSPFALWLLGLVIYTLIVMCRRAPLDARALRDQ